MKLFLPALLLFISINCGAQNLIQNWSFEDTIACAINPNFGGPETAPPWESLTQSPDYFSYDYCGSGFFPAFGVQVPTTGNAMVGFLTYTPFYQNHRETIKEPLNDTLKSGHSYCVSFYVSLAGRGQFAVDGIAALFTSFPMTSALVYSFSLNPQIRNPIGNVITDTLNWTLISGSFTAQGGEKYITIGNLFDDANTQVDSMTWGNPSGQYGFSYYYIDDISVIDCTTGLEEINNNNNFSISPTIATENIQLSFINLKEKINIEILNTLGQVVYKEGCLHSTQLINVAALSKGVYFVKASGKGSAAVKKFVKE